MELYEDVAIHTEAKMLVPLCDDIFVVRRHKSRSLVTSQLQNKLAFLDVLALKNANGSLGQQVYCKPTHTDIYSYQESNTIWSRSMQWWRCSLSGQVMQSVWSSRTDLPDTTVRQEKTDSHFPEYIRGITEQIGKLLKRHYIQTNYCILQRMWKPAFFRSVKCQESVPQAVCTEYLVHVGNFTFAPQNAASGLTLENTSDTDAWMSERSLLWQSMHWGTSIVMFSKTAIMSTVQKHFPHFHRQVLEMYKYRDQCTNTNVWQLMLLGYGL